MMTNFYVLFFLFVCALYSGLLIFKKGIHRHKKDNVAKKLTSYHQQLSSSHGSYLNEDGQITGKALEVINKIHLLDKNIEDKKGFISDLKYKLIYAYGDKPLKHALILYAKSTSALYILPYFLKFSPIIGGIFSLGAGILITIALINRAYNKNIARFLDNFVYAMDIIVRGVRTGLPLNVCFQKITEDVDFTVAEQFVAILNDSRLGMTVEQTMERFMQRMPLNEVSFFCLSIMIQGKTGGNLAEIINNLAIVLRKRKSMIIKIQTLSSEARASMKIMMSLPVFVVLVLKFMAADYIDLLFNQGKIVLFGCIIWMSIGGFIMSRMVNLIR